MTDGLPPLVDYWLARAAAALDSARSEYAAGRCDFAVNRAYYAAFYAASAVMHGRGRRFVKHAALRAAVHRELARPRVIDRRFAAILDRLFESRQRADYLDLVQFDREEAGQLIADAEAFVAVMQSLVARTPEDPRDG